MSSVCPDRKTSPTPLSALVGEGMAALALPVAGAFRANWNEDSPQAAALAAGRDHRLARSSACRCTRRSQSGWHLDPPVSADRCDLSPVVSTEWVGWRYPADHCIVENAVLRQTRITADRTVRSHAHSGPTRLQTTCPGIKFSSARVAIDRH